MDKKTAYKLLLDLHDSYAADKIDESQLDAGLVMLINVLANEIDNEAMHPKSPGTEAILDGVSLIQSEVASIRAMLETIANPPAYRTDTASIGPPAW